MEFCRELALERLNSLSSIAFKSIIHTGFQQILDCSKVLNYHEKSEFKETDPVILEQCFISLTSFIVEICKNDTGDELIRSYLAEDSRWTDDRVASFLNKLKNYKQKIRARLSYVGWSHPHITNCSWKLNLAGKNNFVEEKETTYIIDFELDEERFIFQCNCNALQDAIFKLKECCKSMSNFE